MANKYCLNCGSQVPDGLKYCPVCGSPLRNNKGNDGQDKLKINPRVIPEPNVDLEDEPLPKRNDDLNSTQQLNLNSIRSSGTSEPDFEHETIQLEEESSHSDHDQKEHGKLYSFFIEDENDGEDEEEKPVRRKKEHHSHAGLIVFLIILAALVGCFAFVLYRKPEVFNRLTNRRTESTAEPEETKTPVPSSTPVPTVSAEPEETSEADEGIIGSLEPLETINERNEPSTDADTVGTVSPGTTYDVYEISEDGDLTWYKIGENEWVADGGGWVDYTAEN